MNYIARCVTHRWRWLQNASQDTVINDTPFYGNCNDFHDLENRSILSIYLRFLTAKYRFLATMNVILSLIIPMLKLHCISAESNTFTLAFF